MSVVYGRPYSKCGYCGKYVRLSGFFAGLHLCVDAETRALLDFAAASFKAQQRAQMASTGQLERLLKSRPKELPK